MDFVGLLRRDDVRNRLLDFMRRTLSESLTPYRGRLPRITVEVAEPEKHGDFVPPIAELLVRENERGTKGMSGSGARREDQQRQVLAAMADEQAVIVYCENELIGYASFHPWNVDGASFLEFSSAVVDDPFRGAGFGRVLVDAREILAVESYMPAGYQPIAFCNQLSARIYNRDFWAELPWESYHHLPWPAVCRPECQSDRRSCDCTVLALDAYRLIGLLKHLPVGP